MRPAVREAADVVIGNLNEDGYLIASDEELLGIAPAAPPEVDAAKSEIVVKEAAALGLAALADQAIEEAESAANSWNTPADPDALLPSSVRTANGASAAATAPAVDLNPTVPHAKNGSRPIPKVNFNQEELKEAIEIVRQLDPPGVACRDLRECLLSQLRYHQMQLGKSGNGTAQVLTDAIALVDQHLRALQNKQYKEISRAIGRPTEGGASCVRLPAHSRSAPRLSLQHCAAPFD